MNFSGIIIGISAFLIIGILHPVVIKGEYYFGKKIWPLFLVFGIISILLSIYFENLILSSCFGVLGFSLFWSIKEIYEQEERVKKGWFPKREKK